MEYILYFVLGIGIGYLLFDFIRDLPFLIGIDEASRKEYQRRIDKRIDDLHK